MKTYLHFVRVFRHASDCQRQKKLAKLRYEARRMRVELGRTYLVQLDDVRPDKGEKDESRAIIGWH